MGKHLNVCFTLDTTKMLDFFHIAIILTRQTIQSPDMCVIAIYFVTYYNSTLAQSCLRKAKVDLSIYFQISCLKGTFSEKIK